MSIPQSYGIEKCKFSTLPSPLLLNSPARACEGCGGWPILLALPYPSLAGNEEKPISLLLAGDERWAGESIDGNGRGGDGNLNLVFGEFRSFCSLACRVF